MTNFTHSFNCWVFLLTQVSSMNMIDKKYFWRSLNGQGCPDSYLKGYHLWVNTNFTDYGDGV